MAKFLDLSGLEHLWTNLKVKIDDILTPSVKTVSGSIVSFADGIKGVPVKSLIANVDPVQDLHGYDHPWVGGAGKNILNNTLTTRTVNGVTLTVNTDGTISTTGTATGLIQLALNVVGLEQGVTYYLNGCPSGGSSTTYELNVGGGTIRDYGSGGQLTTTSSVPATEVRIVIREGANVNGLTFKPMLRTTGDASYEPYENICPITPRTSATVTHLGKNMVSGAELAQRLVENGATIDPTNKTVTYSGAIARATGVIFNKFKPNTVYTIMARVTGSVLNINAKVFYTDGTILNLADMTSEVTKVWITNANKSVDYVTFEWITGSPIMYYEEFGIFEGVLTASDFEHYVDPATYTKSFNACYGGKLNLTTGALEFTRIGHVFDGSESFITAGNTYIYNFGQSVRSSYQNYSSTSCSHFKVGQYGGWTDVLPNEYIIAGTYYVGVNPDMTLSDYKAYLAEQANNGTPVVATATLTEPQTIQLTTEEVKTLLGGNTFYADTGDVEVVYYVDKRITNTVTELINVNTYSKSEIDAMLKALSDSINNQ